MSTISANELKTKGITLLEPIIQAEHTAIITVRGKMRYVVMDMEMYNHLRECELEAAISETKCEMERGEYISESVSDHIKRIQNEL